MARHARAPFDTCNLTGDPLTAAQTQRLAVRCFTAICAVLASMLGLAQAHSLQQSFDLQVPWVPMPVVVGGQNLLVYELHMTNFAAVDLTLRQIEVLDSSGATLKAFRDSELTGILGRFDQLNSAADRLRIPPGVRVVAYLSVPIATHGANPFAVRHRVEYQASGSSDHASVEGGTFAPSAERLSSIGPPLRGGPWVAIYNTSWERGHRRVPYAVDGSVHIPGRFAIDWIKVDTNGKYFNGDGSTIKDWYGYGAEVLAVSDGIVAATRDNVAESLTLVRRAQPLQPADASGNYVALNLGAGHFAFYEHLLPGSVRVKSGNRVRRGEVVGQLGYTGESTGPHLHFHMSDRNSPLNAEGLPYQLQRFQVLGSYESVEAFGKSMPWSELPQRIDARPGGEFPGPFAVVQFLDNSSDLKGTQ
jgi:murein DD-endopeptidase